MKFEELGLAEPILRAVAATGYTTPTPVQAQSIPHALAGRDLLACAQTGTGKTAAFALPILHRLLQSDAPARGRRRVRVLVLSPTRELALQTAECFGVYGARSGLRQASIVGGVNQNPQVRALRQGVDILVATPGRMLDLVNQGLADLSAVEVLVLDEADRMLDMGFLPDVRRLIAKLPARRQTLFFSATMPEDIRKLADAILRDPVLVRVAPARSTTELITQSVYNVDRQNKIHLLSSLLKRWPVTRALVFTRTKHGADKVVRMLGRANIRAEAIHGNKSQAARQRTLANFKADRTQILVATDIAARGIDVDNISHVLNYDLPETPETYVHRIGRTGRAGAEGIAVSFCDREERVYLQAIQRLIRQTLTVEDDHPDYPPTKAVPQPAGRRPFKQNGPSKQRTTNRPAAVSVDRPATTGPPRPAGTTTRPRPPKKRRYSQALGR